MREPVEVELHRGTNLIEIRLERHFPGQRFHAAFVED